MKFKKNTWKQFRWVKTINLLYVPVSYYSDEVFLFLFKSLHCSILNGIKWKRGKNILIKCSRAQGNVFRCSKLHKRGKVANVLKLQFVCVPVNYFKYLPIKIFFMWRNLWCLLWSRTQNSGFTSKLLALMNNHRFQQVLLDYEVLQLLINCNFELIHEGLWRAR